TARTRLARRLSALLSRQFTSCFWKLGRRGARLGCTYWTRNGPATQRSPERDWGSFFLSRWADVGRVERGRPSFLVFGEWRRNANDSEGRCLVLPHHCP